MKHKGGASTIRAKISRIVLGVSMLALLLSAAVSLIGIQSAKRKMLDSSEALGSTAAADSEQALIAQAKENLIVQAMEKADLTEQRLLRIKAQVSLMAAYIAPLYEQTVIISDSRPQRDGDWVMQYANVNTLADEQVQQEIARTKNAFYVLQPLCRQNEQDISSVYFASASGFMLSYDPKSEDNAASLFQDDHFDPRDRDWYTNAVETGEAVFTKTYLDVFSRLMVTCSTPVYAADGSVEGVFGMDILIEDINASIVGSSVGENGYAFLFNNDGEVISSPKLTIGSDGKYHTTLLRDEPGFAQIADAMVAGESGFHETVGEELFVAYARVRSTHWGLGIVLPRDEVVAPAVATRDHIITQTNKATDEISSMIAMMLLLVAVAIVVIIVIVTLTTEVLSRRITEPILTLTDGAKIIGSGDLDYTVSMHTGDELELLGDTLNHMTVSLKEYMNNLAAITADRERIAAELGVATTIQASMLPCIFPAFPGRKEFNIFANMHPAKEVGGDFYDFFLTDPDHLWVVIADVSGKGVPAALFMVITKTLLKNYAAFHARPGEVLTLVNTQLCENNDAGMFVTAFMGVLEISTGKFTFSNAGHNAPLLYHGGAYAWLKTTPGFVLAGLDGITFSDHEIVLSKGDRLFLYTDGVTEALDPHEELYGDDRLLHMLNTEAVKKLPIDQTVRAVEEDIRRFADGAEQADDITMLTLEIC